MTAPQTTPPTARATRLVHGAMVTGLILFAIVAHFVLLPKASGAGSLASITAILLGMSLAGCVASTLLSTRVPRSSDDESADSFWKRAGPSAMIVWALLEGAGLLAIVLYSHTGSRAAISVAGVAVFSFVLLNPAYFEGR